MRLFLALAALACCPVYAQQTDIEEIVVIGELSRPAVRAQIVRVENDIYNFYNTRNGDNKLDIVCREVAVTGTMIKQRVCEPIFWTEARSRNTQNFLQEWNGSAELEDLSNDVQDQMAEMNRVYAQLIQDYPSFAEALLVLEDLKARLEELGG